MALAGRTLKTDRHDSAVEELKRAGKAGANLATTFERLLKLKNRSQYRADPVSASDAAKAVEWAQRMHASAAEIIRSG